MNYIPRESSTHHSLKSYGTYHTGTIFYGLNLSLGYFELFIELFLVK